MRLAMLAPIAHRISSQHQGHREKVVSLLTEGLVRRGVEVTLFATQDSETKGKLASVVPRGYEEDPKMAPGVWEPLHISGVFESGDEFDLIHNHLDCLPLTYLKMTSTPMVTTIHEALSPQVLDVYKKYNGLAFYVAASDALRYPELDCVATIRQGVDEEGFSVERMVLDYFRVYEKILAQRHREDHRPWGYYLVLEDEPNYKVKRIVVYPGQRLSLQRHRRRAEHWLVVQGHAEVVRNDETLNLEAGQAVDIPRGAWHRVRNPGTENMAFIEVQSGDYFGEDDIERAEDDYGRAR
jgi:mannose-6-phosphate isomerase-like protein (cupin superfamily)